MFKALLGSYLGPPIRLGFDLVFEVWVVYLSWVRVDP